MKHSYTRDVLDYLVARPGIDVDGLELARIGGAYAWRTRVSEARGLIEAMGQGTIENEQRRMSDGRCVSVYRYVPPWDNPRVDEDDERGPRGMR